MITDAMITLTRIAYEKNTQHTNVCIGMKNRRKY